MGVFCCVDRDKVPPDEPLPLEPPSEGFLTKKPKATIKKIVLMIASDPEILTEILDMLSRSYQITHKDQVAILDYEDWEFEILSVPSSDAARLAATANQAKVVFFFFDLKDGRALSAAHTCASTFRALTRKDSVKYLAGYNSTHSSQASAEATETAADLHFIYIELPFPRNSSRQLLDKMIG